MGYLGHKVAGPNLCEIDSADRKLLYLLSINARFQTKDLAEALELSPDTVKYRLERLQKQKVITGFTLTFNRRMVGYEAVDLYFKIPKVEQRLFERLIKHPKIYWLATARGPYNLCISTNCEDLSQVQDIVLFIRENVGVDAEQMIFLPLYYEHSVPHEYLMQGITIKPLLRTYNPGENSLNYEFQQRDSTQHGLYSLDDVEKKVLDILIQNSRAPLLQIALRVHKSVNTIKKIITNLVNQNVIIQFETKISTQLFGYFWGLLFFKYATSDKKEQKRFLEFLAKQYYAHWFTYCAGEYDLILSAYTKDKDEFDTIRMSLLKEFSGTISTIDNIAIDTQYKHMHCFLNPHKRKVSAS